VLFESWDGVVVATFHATDHLTSHLLLLYII